MFCMAKKIQQAILPLIYFLFTQSAYSQSVQDMQEYLKKQFLRYTGAVPREELFVHSDREEYIAGEELWFNLYLIDRQSLKPSSNSRIAYFELLNDKNRPVQQKRILIDKGFGPGQIELPDTLSTGIYTIRAYTSWMKNFLPENCFMKDIVVYNALNPEAPHGNSEESKRIGKETGNGPAGKIKKTGVTLSVNSSKPDMLEILIHADTAFRSENNNLFFIFIQTRGNIDHVSTEKLTGDTTTIHILKTALSPGINQIDLFNAMGEPVGERFIYTPEKESAWPSVYSDDTFDLRSRIALEVGLVKEDSASINKANLSISVSPLTRDQESTDLNEYLLFGTEYGELPWNAIKGRKISAIPPEEMDSILLRVSSNWINWETILSADMPVFKYPMEKEYHFLLGRLLNSDQQAAGAGEVLVLCTPGKEAGFQYARTGNEGNFRFRIHIDEELEDLILMPVDVHDNQKIVIESSFSDQNSQTDLLNGTIKRPVPPYISKMSVNYQVSAIYSVTSMGSPLNPVITPSKPVRFYGKPDIELIMADYISLPVMEEVFFEILPHVSLKKEKSGYDISITDRVDNRLYVTSPSLMIDGVLIKDPAMIIGLDPEIVEKIDVIKERYRVGNYVFPGIINVITKSGDFSCVSLPGYMIRIPYRVTDPVWSFVSPEYANQEMESSRIPDYRNTLYWNPSVKPDKEGKAVIEFWSSDNRSDYIINIQGITQGGKAFSLKKIIRVK
jgi:hypothetical protein